MKNANMFEGLFNSIPSNKFLHLDLPVAESLSFWSERSESSKRTPKA